MTADLNPLPDSPLGDGEGEEELEQASLAEQLSTTAEPASFLAMYYRDLARVAPLRPRQEFAMAHELESLELAWWHLVLSRPALIDTVSRLSEEAWQRSDPELSALWPLLSSATPLDTVDATDALPRAVHRIQKLDRDKLLFDRLFPELERLKSSQLLSPEEHQELRLAFQRVRQAKNDFIRANLRLVVVIARRFNFGRMALADLIQEGNLGLVKAVDRYDYRRGYRFSTYASWWIRHAISRALADKGRAVRLPVHLLDSYHRLARAERELSAKLGRRPSAEELGRATGIPTAKVERTSAFIDNQQISLDKPYGDDEDGRRLIDVLQDPETASRTHADVLVDRALAKEVHAQFVHLKPVEADVLRQRFGIDTDTALTLKQIGDKYHLSRERIRQIQEQALTKMRRAFRRRGLS